MEKYQHWQSSCRTVWTLCLQHSVEMEYLSPLSGYPEQGRTREGHHFLHYIGRLRTLADYRRKSSGYRWCFWYASYRPWDKELLCRNDWKIRQVSSSLRIQLETDRHSAESIAGRRKCWLPDWRRCQETRRIRPSESRCTCLSTGRWCRNRYGGYQCCKTAHG